MDLAFCPFRPQPPRAPCRRLLYVASARQAYPHLFCGSWASPFVSRLAVTHGRIGFTCVTDRTFTSCCSPPRLAATQLQLVTSGQRPLGGDLHPSDLIHSQAHWHGRLARGVAVRRDVRLVRRSKAQERSVLRVPETVGHCDGGGLARVPANAAGYCGHGRLARATKDRPTPAVIISNGNNTRHVARLYLSGDCLGVCAKEPTWARSRFTPSAVWR